MNSSVGPFLLRSEFLKSKYTGDGPISTFLAQVREHYTQLSSTRFAITEADLMTHVLTNDVLPKRLEQTVKYLWLQAANLTWNALTQTFINKDIQSKPENPDPTLTTAMATKSQKQKHRIRKGNYKWKTHSTKSDTEDSSDNNQPKSKKWSKWKSDSESDSESDDRHQLKKQSKSLNKDLRCFTAL